MSETADERVLFEAWCAGDRNAGALLFERHYESIARFFHNKVACHLGVDLIQATFLGCVEARGRFRGESGFRTFLFAVARNVLHKHYRTQRGPNGRIEFGEVTAVELGPSASTAMRAREEQQLLLEALRRVPVEHQEVLELLYWERLSVAEIAEIVGAPEGTVKTRLRRGRALLEQKMQELAATPDVLDSTLSGFDRWAEQLRAKLGRAP